MTGEQVSCVAGETTGFAHTADLSEEGLMIAARAAASATRTDGAGSQVNALEQVVCPSPNKVETFPELVAKERR